MTNIVVSLEQAKLLKENGWDKYCEFYYECHEENHLLHKNTFDDYCEWYRFSWLEAPTAEELLQELPWNIDNTYFLKVSKVYSDGDYEIWYELYEYYDMSFIWDNLSDILAYLWIWCKKNWYLNTQQKETE